jgi:hypothetical protein
VPDLRDDNSDQGDTLSALHERTLADSSALGFW